MFSNVNPVFQFDFTRYGNTSSLVISRRTEKDFVQNHVTAFSTEGDFHRIRASTFTPRSYFHT